MKAPFCPAPWASLVILPEGQITPCCAQLESNIHYTSRISLQDVRQSESFLEMRSAFVEGEWPRQCGFCREKENQGLVSKRQKLLRLPLFSDLTPDTVSDQEALRYMEISFSNHCNLACVMCSGKFSHKWQKIHQDLSTHSSEVSQELHGKFFKEYREFQVASEQVEDLAAAASSVVLLEIVGGEPFVDPRLKNFLEVLAQMSQQPEVVSIVTNASVYNVAAYSAFKNLRSRRLINVSIDGVGACHDFIRGFPFERLEMNIRRILTEVSPCEVNFSPTMSLANIFGVRDLLLWFAPLKNEFPFINLTFHQTVNPDQFMSVMALPEKVRVQAAEEMQKCFEEDLVPVSAVSDYLNLMEVIRSTKTNAEPSWQDASREQIQYFSERNGVNLFEIFPQLRF